jgi:IS605 OrfB family transposase
MSEKRMTITKKMQLLVDGDKDEVKRVYDFIRNGQYAQYRAMNRYMGEIASIYYKHNMDFKSDGFQTEYKEIRTNKNEIFQDLEFSTGVDTISQARRTVESDFMASVKNGLAKGERTITNYKREYPLLTYGRSLKFYHDYADDYEMYDNLDNKDFLIYLGWVNKIRFKVRFGNPYKSHELRTSVARICDGTYKIQGSKITIIGKKIFLFASVSIPILEKEMLEDNVCGVKFGKCVTATCVTNIDKKKYVECGNADVFLMQRAKMKAMRERTMAQLKYSKGGHGRKKKLKPLERFRKREHNFAKTYNHTISKEIVNFAFDNRCSKIVLEDLSIYENDDEFVTKNWSYFDLEEIIKYKAKRYGITVETKKLDIEKVKDENWSNVDLAFELTLD